MGTLGARSFFMNSEGVVSDVASVQYGYVSATAAGATAAITSVDTTKSAVFMVGIQDAGVNDVARVALTNSTTVTAYSSDSNIDVYFMVVTFNGVKSIQDFSVNVGGVLSATTTITSVNTAKSIIAFRGWQHNTTDNVQSLCMDLTLTNSTTVTGHHQSTEAAQGIVYGTVIEFN